MADSSQKVALASIAVAVVCAGWAIYATKHRDAAPGGMMGPPAGVGAPGMAAPGAAGGSSGRPGQGAGGAGAPGKGGAPGPGGPAGMMGGGMGGGMPTPVRSAEVAEQALQRELKAIGTAGANEAVVITSKASNVVAAVRFRDGQAVQRGQVLVELDSAQARADLAAADAALTESTSLYNRSRELLATQAVSKSQFDQIEATKKANEARVAAARARLEDTVIRAPFSGRVGLRRVSVGSLVNPGTAITTLDDTSVIKVDFAVPENFISAVQEGLMLGATTTAYPGRVFKGRVASVDSRVDPNTRSVTVRAVVPNPEALLKPGMFLNVELVRDQRSALVIPEEALVPEQQRQFVFVVADGRASKREVQIGARRPGSVEVLSGLARGERIVVEGTIKLRDGGPVRDLALAVAPGAAPQGGG